MSVAVSERKGADKTNAREITNNSEPNASEIDDGKERNKVLRLLAKNQSDNRALIEKSVDVPALIPLLQCSDLVTQEHSITASLNLSLHEENKPLISHAGAIKSLILCSENRHRNLQAKCCVCFAELSREERCFDEPLQALFGEVKRGRLARAMKPLVELVSE
ncbi:hypothetical protein LguiA_006583 [Lonicera macranthoides]